MTYIPWLTLWLQSLGADVAGLSLAPEGDCLFSRARASEGIRSVIGDVRDLAMYYLDFLDGLGLPKVHLAGISLGGMTASTLPRFT